MVTIPIKTVLSNLTKGGLPCYQCVVKDRKNMKTEEFVRLFAERLGETPARARYINDVHGQVVAECIVGNKIVNTGNLRGYLVIKGSSPSAGAPLNKVDNPVVVVMNATGELAEAVAGITPVNDTQVIEAVLYTVQYEDSPRLNTIEGTGTLKLNGKGLVITFANEDEGVWLESEAGVIVSDKAEISVNDENTINCAFEELPEETLGDRFKLVIATRNGLSKDEYGVTRLERWVDIVRD